MSHRTLVLFTAGLWTALWLSSAVPARAGALAPSKPSQLVTLGQSGAQGVCSFADQDQFDLQITRDGNAAPFAVPPGMVLVVTSVEWFGNAASPASAQYFVFAPPGNNGFYVPGTVGPLGGGGSVSLAPAGFVVGNGNALCGATGTLAVGGNAVAHGFLAKDR